MSAKIKVMDVTAQLDNEGVWTADDPRMAKILNALQPLVPDTPDVPNYDLASARFMIDYIGRGEVLEYDPVEFDPEKIY